MEICHRDDAWCTLNVLKNVFLGSSKYNTSTALQSSFDSCTPLVVMTEEFEKEEKFVYHREY